MNLKNWLQPKYILENLKRSKALLVLILFLFPLLISLVQISTTTFGVVNLLENSALTLLGMYIIPVILSFSFFSFVYKKKKVDFVMGLPLSRKQIFISNTICGIAIIMLMFFMNIIFLLLFSWFSTQWSFNSSMLLDYYLIYTSGYILVFTVTNVAMGLSGNFITQIIVTLLLLFLFPFCSILHTSYVYSSPRLVELSCKTNNCKTIQYDRCVELTGITNCMEQAKSGYYYTDLNKSKPVTYHIAVESLLHQFSENYYLTYQSDMMIKTFILSIIMVGLGIFIFQKRNMEQCETSFTNFHIHSLVKSLTLLPFSLLLAATESYDIGSISIILLIFLAYFYLYDLITRKKVQHVWITLLYFIGVMIVSFGYFYGLQFYLNSKIRSELTYIKEELTVSDIKGFSLLQMNASDFDIINGYDMKDIIFEGKEQINQILPYVFAARDLDEKQYSLTVTLYLKNNTNYHGFISLTENEYNQCINSLRNSIEIKELKKITSKDILGIRFLEMNYSKQQLKEILPIIEETLVHPITKSDEQGSEEIIYIMIYQNHKFQVLSLPISLNQKISNYLLKHNNQKILDALLKERIVHAQIGSDNLYTSDSKKLKEMVQWIKMQSINVDSNQSYVTVSIFTNDNNVYHYVTNNNQIMNYFEKEEIEE